MPRGRLLPIAFAALLAVAAFAAPAGAAGTPAAVAVPGSFLYGYVTPVLVAAPGDAVVFANADVAPHDVVASDAFGSSDRPWCARFSGQPCPLFASALIGAGRTADVLGLDAVEKGRQYEFYCTLHPHMTGTLVVT